jgi:hypothetical protein
MESLMQQTNQSACFQGTPGLESAGKYYNAFVSTPTQLSNRFMAPNNITYLQKQLEFLLTKLVGQPVKVPITEEFTQSLYDVASRNAGLKDQGDGALQSLNEMFLEWEGRIQYLSIRQQKLYDQYFIREDRIRTFPYPEPTKVMKGEVVIDTSGYQLVHPFHNQWQNYLWDVYKITCPPTPGGAAKCGAVPHTQPYPHNYRS